MVRHFTIALLLAAVAAHAETFRFFGSVGAETQLTPANGQSPLNPGNIGGVPYRTDVGDLTTFAEVMPENRVWKVRLKVRGDASDQSTDQVRLNEGFLQLNPRPWLDVTLGRVIEKWGTAYAWNPTAFVSPLKNPTDPNDRRSAYRGLDMVKADVFMHGTNLSLYAMQQRAFAARLYRLIANTDVSLHVRHDPGLTREGISVARVFGNALELHAEVAHFAPHPGFADPLPAARGEGLHHPSPRVRGEGPRSGSEGAYIQTVAGGQYTFPNNVNVVFELYHGGDGMSGAEWRSLRERVDRGDLLFGNSTYAPLKMARDYSFIRIDLPWNELKNDLEVIAIANLRDRSSLARVTFTRKVRPNLSAYLIETEFFGAADSEFAYIQVKRATTFGARYYF